MDSARAAGQPLDTVEDQAQVTFADDADVPVVVPNVDDADVPVRAPAVEAVVGVAAVEQGWEDESVVVLNSKKLRTVQSYLSERC